MTAESVLEMKAKPGCRWKYLKSLPGQNEQQRTKNALQREQDENKRFHALSENDDAVIAGAQTDVIYGDGPAQMPVRGDDKLHDGRHDRNDEGNVQQHIEDVPNTVGGAEEKKKCLLPTLDLPSSVSGDVSKKRHRYARRT